MKFRLFFDVVTFKLQALGPSFLEFLDSFSKPLSWKTGKGVLYSSFDFILIFEPHTSEWLLHWSEQMIIAWSEVGRIRWVREKLPSDFTDRFHRLVRNLDACVVLQKQRNTTRFHGSFSRQQLVNSL